MLITGSGKPASREPGQEPLAPAPPPRQPAPPRSWPYDPDEATLLQWINTALHHHVHIRATGSLPAIGGPSIPLTSMPESAAGFRFAAQLAESWWPNARSFDLIGSDLEYKGDEDTTILQPGMKRLRNAAVITSYTVTDRGTVTPPGPPPAPQPATPDAAE